MTEETAERVEALNIQKIKTILLLLITDPKNNWYKVKDEYSSTKEVFMNFLLPTAGISALALFAFEVLFGVGLTTAVFSNLIFLLELCILVYVGAIVLTKLAPTFNASCDELHGVKLLSFSSGVASVASIAVIVPVLGWIVALIGALYSLYVFYLGLSPMTGVSQEDRPKYAAIFFGAMLVAGYILHLVTMPLHSAAM